MGKQPGDLTRLGRHETRGLDKDFGASIAKLYEQYLVPLIFEPYATSREPPCIATTGTRAQLAAGTGIATRALSSTLPAGASLVATDLNQPMLNEAAARRTRRPVEWRQADASSLPFDAASFDAVVCQFGVMFFPDRSRAMPKRSAY